MKNITTRLSELEIKIKSKNNIPVLIVDENKDGTFSLDGKTYTQEQLDIFCKERGVDVLIIDDIGRLQ